MKLPEYPRYKDSGFEWLGKVPEHWEVTRLKRIATVMPSNVDKKAYEHEALVRLCNYTDVYYNDLITDEMNFMEATASPEQIARFSLREADTIITKDSETPDDIARSAYVTRDLPGIVCGYHLAIIRPSRKGVGAFLKWVFDARFTRSVVEVGANGLTRYGLSQHTLDNIPVACPSREEQTDIARFITNANAQIDSLISRQKRLISLLNEKRQTVITRAVTVGLNTGKRMKPSGIHWLGDVPTHWNVHRIAMLYKEINEPGNDELPFLRVSIHDGVSDRQLGDEELGRKVNRSEDSSKYKRVAPGDLVYNMMRAWQGGFGTVMVPGQISPAYVVARPKSNFSSRFIELLLRTPQAIEEIRCRSYGVADFRLRLYWDNFKNIRVALPPESEQDEILAHIERLERKFNDLIEKATISIATLQERRSALISAAVTGKIDVRSLATSEAA